MLASLDVIALYTNIPKELVLQGIEKRWNEIARNTKLSLTQFLYAIEFVLISTCFVFNEQYYEQIFGSPMGSPLSPILADMVMNDLESSCRLLLDFEINTFYRYVDDVFVIIPREKLNDILNVFNKYYPRLQFTYELENENSLSFLDVKVIRQGSDLLTNWYHKPMFSGRCINYYSSHSLQYKINTIINLIDHAILLADEFFHKSNIKIVKDILINNSFPVEIINKQI